MKKNWQKYEFLYMLELYNTNKCWVGQYYMSDSTYEKLEEYGLL